MKKDPRILEILSDLEGHFGSDAFQLTDYWESDLLAVGLTDNQDQTVAYIFVNDNDEFYLSFEPAVKPGDDPEPAFAEFKTLSKDQVLFQIGKHFNIVN